MATDPTQSEPLDMKDEAYALRQIHFTDFMKAMNTDQDPSMPYQAMVESHRYVTMVEEYIAKCINDDPYRNDSRLNHFRKDADKEIAPFLRQAFFFFRVVYPDSDDRSAMRFATISFLEGPDRAFVALENQDSLWTQFMIGGDPYRRPAVLYGTTTPEHQGFFDLPLQPLALFPTLLSTMRTRMMIIFSQGMLKVLRTI